RPTPTSTRKRKWRSISTVVHAPVADIVEEARRLIAAATGRGLRLRLVGGLAIRVHAHRDHPSLDRAFKDIDVVTVRKGERDVGRFLRELGYEPDSAFNTLNSGRRALFYDVVHQRQLDVF